MVNLNIKTSTTKGQKWISDKHIWLISNNFLHVYKPCLPPCLQECKTYFGPVSCRPSLTSINGVWSLKSYRYIVG